LDGIKEASILKTIKILNSWHQSLYLYRLFQSRLFQSHLFYAGFLSFQIVLWGRTEKCLKETTEEIRQMGTECHYFICDVGNREEVYQMAKAVREKVSSLGESGPNTLNSYGLGGSVVTADWLCAGNLGGLSMKLVQVA
jgi:hypothetical protein